MQHASESETSRWHGTFHYEWGMVNSAVDSRQQSDLECLPHTVYSYPLLVANWLHLQTVCLHSVERIFLYDLHSSLHYTYISSEYNDCVWIHRLRIGVCVPFQSVDDLSYIIIHNSDHTYKTLSPSSICSFHGYQSQFTEVISGVLIGYIIWRQGIRVWPGRRHLSNKYPLTIFL